MSNTRSLILPFIIVAVLIAAGCSEDLFTGNKKDNIPPIVTITSAPIERANTNYKIHFYWDAADPDGRVKYCQYCIVSGDPYGFSPTDTVGKDKWTNTIDENGTVFNDKLFNFPCDSVSTKYSQDTTFTRFEKTHTFFIRAIDAEWAPSKVQHVSFTSWTLAPKVSITEPEGSNRVYGTVITFAWSASDAIDSPFNTQNPEEVRYLCEQLEYLGRLIPPEDNYELYYRMDEVMNKYPRLFENEWKDWIKYSLSDTGSSVKIGPKPVGSYVFAIQAKDEAGAVTSIMERDVNLRTFYTSTGNKPVLLVSEPTVGSAQFVGTGGRANEVKLPPSVELRFSWSAQASQYGGRVVAYRYGWDVSNLDNDKEWGSNWGIENRNAVATYYTGTHNLFIQVKDDGGRLTTGVIRIIIVPFNMEKDLLLVDDWSLSEYDYGGMFPKESSHDQFLKEIIQERVPSFIAEEIPVGDIYDVSDNAKNITIEDLSNYKNIIWIYGDIVSTTGGKSTNWRENILFVPESEAGSESRINLLKLFLNAGGHLLSYGKSGRTWGGLSDCFRLLGEGYPKSISVDLVEDEDDDSWQFSMPYGDYGANVLDRVRFYANSRHINSMTMAVIDREDAVTSMYPGLPDTLVLREEISTNGAFWDPTNDPSLCGFWFVECFNGPRQMENLGVYRIPEWFHPMYRMRACNSNSNFDYAPVALIMTKSAHIQPFAEGGIKANSFHFGFPLWYYNRESVGKIFDTIFYEWRIRQ